MKRETQVNRRGFLTGMAAGALVGPTILARRAGAQPALERLNIGVIGAGGRGGWLMDAFMGFPEVQVIAVADVDRGRVEGTANRANEKYGAGTCTAYTDFRELVARPDLDAVIVASPDHWHALHSIAALEAGKHVYCEKPLANSVYEGRAIARAVEESGKVFQVGSHERSTDSIRRACEIVRAGRLGRVRRVVINLPCDDGHHNEARAFQGVPEAQPVPPGFDYDMWLGHTPLAPYHERRCHFWWRFNLAYGGGEMTDRGAHVLDIAQWALGLDETSPSRIEAYGVQTPGSLYDTFWDYRFAMTYDNGVVFDGGTDGPRGLRFEGPEGTLFVAIHGGALTAQPSRLLSEVEGEDLGVDVGRTPNHQRNFLDAIAGNAQPFAPAEAGHRTAALCHLANIAMKVNRPLTYDPVTEVILGDSEANRLLTPTMRAPWTCRLPATSIREWLPLA